MFGGVALAAALAAAEQASGRSATWATAQFLSPLPCGETLNLQVRLSTRGKHTSQVHVIGRSQGQDVLSVLAATGSRENEGRRQWLDMPRVPSPDACASTQHWRGDDTGLHGQIEVRIAQGHYNAEREGRPAQDGRMIVWVRPKVRVDTDAALLAIFADLAPNGVGNALGTNAGGNSLDNTVRILGAVATEWVLVDVRIRGIERRFAHADTHLFAETGELMALGSQSLILRVRPPAAGG